MKPKSWGRVAVGLWHILPWALWYTAIIQGGAFVFTTVVWLIGTAIDKKWDFYWLWGVIATWGWIVAGFVTMVLVAEWMKENRREFQQTVDHVVNVWEKHQQAKLTAGPVTPKSPEVQREVAEALDPWLKMK